MDLHVPEQAGPNQAGIQHTVSDCAEGLACRRRIKVLLRIGDAGCHIARIALLQSSITTHTHVVYTGLRGCVSICTGSADQCEIVGAHGGDRRPDRLVYNEELDVVKVCHEEECHEDKHTGNLTIEHAE